MRNIIASDTIKTLSPLEADVIGLMIPDKKYTTAQIYGLIKKKRKVAQSSTSVILDRLYKLGLVTRDTETARGGIRFIYCLQRNKEQFERKAVENVVNLMIKKFGTKSIAYFNESFNVKEKKRK